MSPRLSRRRALALPFVVTIAGAASACVVHSDPPPARAHSAPAARPHATAEHTPAGPAGRAEPAPASSEPRPAVVVNPPAPAKPVVVVNPPAPAAGKDRSPRKTSPAGPTQPAPAKKKTPVVVANPPRLPEAPAGGSVFTKKDGTCWWMAETTCPPKATCNPPPPRQVRCKSDGDDEPSR